MKNYSGQFKNYVMSLTYQERRERKLENFREKISDIKKMDSDELDFEYISLKSEYWHRRVQVLCIMTLGLAFLIGMWKCFFSYLEKIHQYVDSMGVNESEIAKLAFAISSFIIGCITITYLIVLICNIHETKKMYRDMLIVDEIRNRIKEK